MMENRSFDHMLGYLNLPPWNVGRPGVDGVSLDPAWVRRFTNFYDSRSFAPHNFTDRLIDDPPHTRPTIALQLGTSLGAEGPMTGFVASYAQRKQRPRSLSHVMGYYTAPDVPLFDFLARNFTVCDHWFSALPAGTQPNRLMRKWMQTIGEDDHKQLQEDPRFRWLDSLENDLKQPDLLPPVVFIEPDYTDIPFGHSAPPNDDHPPSSIDFGQRFLARIYRAFSANPAIWSKCALLVTYDEHGGFFDHLQPPAIGTLPAGPYDPFSTLGVRVPGLVVSPFVDAATVSHGRFDHTSILQLLGERFGNGHYSPAVDRRHQGTPALDRLSALFTRDTPRPDVPHPPDIVADHDMSAQEKAYHQAVMTIREQSPDRIATYFHTDVQGP